MLILIDVQMEVIPYERVFRRVSDVINDPDVKTMIRLIGWETYVLGQYSWLWNMRYSNALWYKALRSKDVNNVYKMLNSHTGTKISQIMLSYCVMKAAYPDLQCWIEVQDNTPFLRFENTVITTRLLNGDYTPSDERICTGFEAADVLIKERGIHSYKRRDIVSLLGSTWNYSRVREAVNAMLEAGGNIPEISKSMKIDQNLIESVSKCALAYRACDVFDNILERTPPFGCRDPDYLSPKIPVKRPLTLSDLDFIFL